MDTNTNSESKQESKSETHKKTTKKPSGKTITSKKTVSKEEEKAKDSNESKNDLALNKVDKSKGYTITALDKDKEKIDKLKLEIIKGSDFKENITKLAENPVMFHFNTNKDFGAEVMVEMDVNLKDGDYVLLRYNEKEEKLEVVQKVEVKAKHTKFIVSKGGDYCITAKASTDSLKDMAVEENSDNTSIVLYVVIGVVALGVVAVAAYALSKKSRKNKDSDEE